MQTQTSSIVSVILSILVLIVIGLSVGFIALVGLDGFSDREGGPALATLGICSSIGLILSAILSGRLTKLFIAKYNWNSFIAVIVSVFASAVAGGVFYGIAFFLSLFVAQAIFSS